MIPRKKPPFQPKIHQTSGALRPFFPKNMVPGHSLPWFQLSIPRKKWQNPHKVGPKTSFFVGAHNSTQKGGEITPVSHLFRGPRGPLNNHYMFNLQPSGLPNISFMKCQGKAHGFKRHGLSIRNFKTYYHEPPFNPEKSRFWAT